MLHKPSVYDALDQLYQDLNTIKQQLQLYADASLLEKRDDHTITMKAETFHAVMEHLARQMAIAMEQTDALQHHQFPDTPS